MPTVNRFVNSAADASGDGTSNALSGGNHAYVSLNIWEAAEQTDLPTDGDTHVVEWDADTDGADTTATSISGWTTGASNGLTIQAAPGEEAVASGWDTGRARLSVANSDVLLINEDYVTLIGLQVESSGTNGSNQDVVLQNAASAGNLVTIDSCRIRGVNGSSNVQSAIRASHSSSIMMIFNTLGYNAVSVNASAGLRFQGATCNVYNSDFYSNDDGIRNQGTTCNVHNVASFNNADDFNGTFATIDFCASDDGDGTNDVAGNEADADWTTDFAGAATGDFTLLTGSPLVGGGIDGPGSGLFSDDINGQARTITWDVGADEFSLVPMKPFDYQPYLVR